MNWILIALIGPLLWGIGRVLNKFIRTKHIDCSISYATIASLVGMFSLLVIPFYGFEMPSLFIILLCLFVGVLHYFAFLLFVKALTLEEVSRIIPLFRFVAIFVLILSAIFLNEKLNANSYIAFLLLVIGGFIISIKKIEGMFRLSKAFYFVMLASFFYAVGGVILKYVSYTTDFTTFFVIDRMGVFLTALIMIFIFYGKFKRSISLLSFRSLSLITLTEVFGVTGVLTAYYAISLASVSLVNAIESFHPVFIFIFATFVSFKYPHIIKEDLNWKVLLTKSIAIFIMIFGLFLL